MIKITKITTADMRGTSNKLSFESKNLNPKPILTMSAKQPSPERRPVSTNAIEINIGVKVPMVLMPITFLKITTSKMASGKTISHLRAFCCSIGKL